MSKKRNITSSFSFAWEGLKQAFNSEPNFRFHLLAALGVSVAGVYFNISTQEWLILVLTIVGVVCLELINTAIEAIVDITSPKISRLAKIAKDVSAAAVLIFSLASIVIGVIIFLPYILSAKTIIPRIKQ
ncbi:MAG: diacylglycerol kinase family protein [Patescibacteria group bacterium]